MGHAVETPSEGNVCNFHVRDFCIMELLSTFL